MKAQIKYTDVSCWRLIYGNRRKRPFPHKNEQQTATFGSTLWNFEVSFVVASGDKVSASYGGLPSSPLWRWGKSPKEDPGCRRFTAACGCTVTGHSSTDAPLTRNRGNTMKRHKTAHILSWELTDEWKVAVHIKCDLSLSDPFALSGTRDPEPEMIFPHDLKRCKRKT